MAPALPSPLLAVLLVTSSSRGSTLSFRFPRRPKLEKRYSKVKYLVAASGGEGLDDKAAGFNEDEMDDEMDANSILSEDVDESSSSDGSSTDAEDADGEDEDLATEAQSESEIRKDDVHEVASSAGGTAATREAAATTAAAEHARKRQRAYQQYLGYDCEILAALLAPKRELCHQKFELVIDDLAFVGHPVCVDKEGRWDPDAEIVTRGRDTSTKKTEQVEGYTIGSPRPENATPVTRKTSSASTPHMTLFHFVLVLDRPDPSPDLPALDLTSWLQIYYDNIAFKMTAALFAEEVRCGYVSRECEKIGQLRERCMDDGQAYGSFLTHAIHISSLARSLKQVHSSISVTNNAFVTINESIDAHLQLPPMLHDPTRMMRIADIETPIDVNDVIFTSHSSGLPAKSGMDAEEIMYGEWSRTTGPFLLPWKTLLLLHDHHHHHNSGIHKDDASEDQDSDTPGVADKGIEVWSRKFTSLLKPTLEGVPTLADMADLLDWSLEDDVYPMVRHLIYYREARVVDVPRVQNYYAVSPLFDLDDLPKLSTSWALRFPTLSPLPAFLALLSSALRPFSTQIRQRAQRQLCLDALIWLLRHEVIVQMHVRLRLIASEACKLRAGRARSLERERILQKRARLSARAERMAAREERLRQKRDLQARPQEQDGKDQSLTSEFSQSAPASGKPATGDECSIDADRFSRGRRNNNRSQSPKEAAEESTTTSALSATRPNASKKPPFGDATALPGALTMTPTPSQGEHHHPGSHATFAGELKFERRPVLRSRSPSRILAMAAGVGSFAGGASSFGSRGSGSHPGSPRGRARHFAHSRESSNTAMYHELPSTSGGVHLISASGLRAQVGNAIGTPSAANQPSSVPSTQVSIQPHNRGISVESRRRRSPSVARLRVTGFGEDEEVYLEGEEDVSEEHHSGEESRILSGKRMAAMREEMRRLSLVGEEKETERVPAHKSDPTQHAKKEAQRSQRRSEDSEDDVDKEDEEEEDDEEEDEEEEDEEDEDDDLLVDYDIEFEPWESHPIASVIPEPSRATGDENEWIAAMVEGRESWLVERLYKLLSFLNGKHTVDEIVYRLQWRRKELRAVLNAFRDDILTFVHP